MVGRPVRLGRGDGGGEHSQMRWRNQGGGQAGEGLGGHCKDFDFYPE